MSRTMRPTGPLPTAKRMTMEMKSMCSLQDSQDSPSPLAVPDLICVLIRDHAIAWIPQWPFLCRQTRAYARANGIQLKISGLKSAIDTWVHGNHGDLLQWAVKHDRKGAIQFATVRRLIYEARWDLVARVAPVCTLDLSGLTPLACPEKQALIAQACASDDTKALDLLERTRLLPICIDLLELAGQISNVANFRWLMARANRDVADMLKCYDDCILLVFLQRNRLDLADAFVSASGIASRLALSPRTFIEAFCMDTPFYRFVKCYYVIGDMPFGRHPSECLHSDAEVLDWICTRAVRAKGMDAVNRSDVELYARSELSGLCHEHNERLFNVENGGSCRAGAMLWFIQRGVIRLSALRPKSLLSICLLAVKHGVKDLLLEFEEDEWSAIDKRRNDRLFWFTLFDDYVGGVAQRNGPAFDFAWEHVRDVVEILLEKLSWFRMYLFLCPDKIWKKHCSVSILYPGSPLADVMGVLLETVWKYSDEDDCISIADAGPLPFMWKTLAWYGSKGMLPSELILYIAEKIPEGDREVFANFLASGPERDHYWTILGSVPP